MDRREWTEQDYREYAREIDTGKEVSTFQPYIEHETRGTSEPAYDSHAEYAPEPTPVSDLEVYPKHPLASYGQHEAKSDQSPTIISHKPLPPAPYESEEPSPLHNGRGGGNGSVKESKKGGMSRKKMIIIGAVVGVLAIIAIVVGAVVGTKNSGDKDGSSGDKDENSPSTSASSTTSSTSTPSPSSTAPVVVVPQADEVKIGSNFTASISFYGSGDGGDGETCKSSNNACSILPQSGFAAGVSQNLYGDGITCGSCWRVQATHDGGGSRLNRKPIVVKVNEMCPAEGYPICGQKDLRSTNQFKMQVNFNLCVDTGAADALFGTNTGVDFATGTVERVDCKEWEGKTKETFRFRY